MSAYTPVHLTEEEIFNRLPEKIGQVSLNYDHYGGRDLYSDGEIEDELLSIVKNVSRVEYRSVIEERKSWPILYHLSDLRGNIVDFLPIGKSDRVLEIGSGCGAITEKLSDMAKSVTCVELSAKRSLINAYRNQDRDNIEIHVGNFSAVEPHLDRDFDWILLIGVFEYASSYIDSKTPYEDFLGIILKHLGKGGHIAIAIENKFGLKYFAGCTEDHLGTFYASLEDYPEGGSARTFTCHGLRKIFRACGVEEYEFYYPYPDYKFPSVIYSNARLPRPGELSDNIRNFDRHRMVTFRENMVFDTILEEGEFPLFSNSYLAILGPETARIYAKYSNDRKSAHAIKTVIEKSNKDLVIKKLPFYNDSEAHIRDLRDYYELLTQRYEGSGFHINKCRLEKDEQGRDTAVFDYVTGVTLSELMDKALFSGDSEGFRSYFKKFHEMVSYNPKHIAITDYDMIFSNVLVDRGDWTIIDYEWSMKEELDPRQVSFRALYCYLLEDDRRNKADVDELLEMIGITPKEAEEYRERELMFQKHVTEQHKALGEIRAEMGTYAIDVKELFAEKLQKILQKRIQIYYDEGSGYSEDNSLYLPDVYREEHVVETDIPFDGNVHALRIDPMDESCVVKIRELVLNGRSLLGTKKSIEANGRMVAPGTYVFETADPNLALRFEPGMIRGENLLHLKMEVIPLSTELATDIKNALKKPFFS